MRVSAIICEYNPFHNGHLYQIEQVIEQFQSDYIIAIMSGDFVQRGGPAIMDKCTRASAALHHGIDLVLELPAVYATASAEGFATGAIRILDSLGCVDDLVFGAEDEHPDLFYELAALLNQETEEYQAVLKSQLKEGLSFPAARESAVRAVLGDHAADLLNQPNNLLGVEYVRALQRLNSEIKPFIIHREGDGYHSDSIDSIYPSASAIRERWLTYDMGPDILNAVPENMAYNMNKLDHRTCPMDWEAFRDVLFYRILTEKHPEQILDYHPEIMTRIRKYLPETCFVEQLIDKVKTKNFTYTRISRFLTHLMLGITAEISDGAPSYAKVLGFRKDSSALLKMIQGSASIPVIQKPTHYDVLQAKENCLTSYELDLMSDSLYCRSVMNRFGQPMPDETGRPLLIV